MFSLVTMLLELDHARDVLVDELLVVRLERLHVGDLRGLRVKVELAEKHGNNILIIELTLSSGMS